MIPVKAINLTEIIHQPFIKWPSTLKVAITTINNLRLWCTPQEAEGLTPPDWVTQDLMKTLIHKFHPFMYDVKDGSPEKIKLLGGKLIYSPLLKSHDDLVCYPLDIPGQQDIVIICLSAHSLWCYIMGLYLRSNVHYRPVMTLSG